MTKQSIQQNIAQLLSTRQLYYVRAIDIEGNLICSGDYYLSINEIGTRFPGFQFAGISDEEPSWCDLKILTIAEKEN